jgi:hypothetical protein
MFLHVRCPGAGGNARNMVIRKVFRKVWGELQELSGQRSKKLSDGRRIRKFLLR